MTYVIGPECIDVLDRSCIDVCPVDCIYEGDRKNYINPVECIDCGACEVECPVAAIQADRVARNDPDRVLHLVDAETFFSLTPPGRERPIGTPGGAQEYGRIGVDTPMVAAFR